MSSPSECARAEVTTGTYGLNNHFQLYTIERARGSSASLQGCIILGILHTLQ